MMLENMMDPHCEAISKPAIFNFALSLFIVLGILVSYLPQHYRIVARRSSEGLSPYFVLLGALSSGFSIFNILMLPTSQADVACCRETSHFACFAGLLGIAQITVQWGCFMVILFLFLIFFPNPGSEPHATTTTTTTAVANDAPSRPTWRTALAVVLTCVAHFFLLLIVSVALLLWRPAALQWWATLLGLGSALLACVQYLPQLWTTWRLQHVMSLSIPMMLIQTPGSFVLAASLAARVGAEGWSAWGVFVVTGVLQGCLLAMGIRFELRDRRKRKLQEEEEEEQTQVGSDEDERAPLLGNSNGHVTHGTITPGRT